MRKSTFMIPARFDLDYIIDIVESNKKLEIPVEELYGSLRNSVYGSGRKYFELPKVDFDFLGEYVKKLHNNNLFFNYVLNLSCLSNKEFTVQGQKEILEFVQKLVDIGITRFTIALPSLIDLFSEYFPEVKITLSIISGVSSMAVLKEYCEYDNISSIYVHEGINRNMCLLKKMIDFAHKHNKQIGIIVNSFCLSECPYRQYHYSFGAHATYGSDYIIPEYYGSKCALQKINDKRNVLNAPWIRPEDIDKYINIGVDRFKVSGREMHANGADMVKVVECYNNKKYIGNLVDLFMCFTKCAYSELFVIENNDKLGEFITDILDNNITCNKYGCSDCWECKDVLSCVTINEKNKKHYINIFNDRIERYKTINGKN